MGGAEDGDRKGESMHEGVGWWVRAVWRQVSAAGHAAAAVLKARGAEALRPSG